MRLYIAGPMTGLPDFNFPAFRAAEEALRGLGFEVENPADNGSEDGKTWADYMRLSLAQVLRSDGVALLDGWLRSKGARLEYRVADELGIPVAALDVWLTRKAHEAAS